MRLHRRPLHRLLCAALLTAALCRSGFAGVSIEGNGIQATPPAEASTPFAVSIEGNGICWRPR